MLIANLTELITSGTSGLSNARVALATDVSIAEVSAAKALKRIYVRLAARTPRGTKPSAKDRAIDTKIMLSTSPHKA